MTRRAAIASQSWNELNLLGSRAMKRTAQAPATAFMPLRLIDAKRYQSGRDSGPSNRRIGTVRSRNIHQYLGGARSKAQSRMESGIQRGEGNMPVRVPETWAATAYATMKRQTPRTR